MAYYHDLLSKVEAERDRSHLQPGAPPTKKKGGGGSYQPFFARMNLTPEERLGELKGALETLGLLKKA